MATLTTIQLVGDNDIKLEMPAWILRHSLILAHDVLCQQKKEAGEAFPNEDQVALNTIFQILIDFKMVD